jgi:hypothetical protein
VFLLFPGSLASNICMVLPPSTAMDGETREDRNLQQIVTTVIRRNAYPFFPVVRERFLF